LNRSSSRGLSSRTVSRAVARSRAVRARVERRRRRTAALVACLGACVGLPLAWSMAEPAQAVVEAAVSKAADLADLLNQRSPGTRTEDQLTKHARAAAKIRTQPKRVAPAAHHPTTEVPSTAALVDLLQPAVVPVELASAEPPPSLGTPPTFGAILDSTPGFTPPGNGNGGTATLPSSEPREVLQPTSAVPEPGTWATMLLGFGLIAWRIRRRPSSRKLRRARL
jgi:hypothetical protein